MIILKKIKEVIEKHWPDPVWSKVIAAVIIFIGSTILTAIFLFVKSIYDQTPFLINLNILLDKLSQNSEVNNSIIVIAILFFLASFIMFCLKFKQYIIERTREKQKNKVLLSNKDLPKIHDPSTVFFSNRLSNAFPGQRGLKWYTGNEAVKRFKVLLAEPLIFNSDNLAHGVSADPIWWFRAGSSLFIDKFSVISKTKILLGNREFEIKRIAVNVDLDYYKCFIYIEVNGEKQTGLNNYSDKEIADHIKKNGYLNEDYGLLGKKAITREEYDDKATIINGNVIDATNSKPRTRFLSDYNFIICAKQAPYNSSTFDRESMYLFNDILLNKSKPDDLFHLMSKYNRYER